VVTGRSAMMTTENDINKDMNDGKRVFAVGSRIPRVDLDSGQGYPGCAELRTIGTGTTSTVSDSSSLIFARWSDGAIELRLSFSVPLFSLTVWLTGRWSRNWRCVFRID
jgi:hypothetical protein